MVFCCCCCGWEEEEVTLLSEVEGETDDVVVDCCGVELETGEVVAVVVVLLLVVVAGVCCVESVGCEAGTMEGIKLIDGDGVCVIVVVVAGVCVVDAFEVLFVAVVVTPVPTVLFVLGAVVVVSLGFHVLLDGTTGLVEFMLLLVLLFVVVVADFVVEVGVVVVGGTTGLFVDGATVVVLGLDVVVLVCCCCCWGTFELVTISLKDLPVLKLPPPALCASVSVIVGVGVSVVFFCSLFVSCCLVCAFSCVLLVLFFACWTTAVSIEGVTSVVGVFVFVFSLTTCVCCWCVCCWCVCCGEDLGLKFPLSLCWLLLYDFDLLALLPLVVSLPPSFGIFFLTSFQSSPVGLTIPF